MTFFPQEDCRKLSVLRTFLTPFLKAVMEALEVKLIDTNESGALLDKIIQNVPAENSTQNFFFHRIQASNDLEFEFDEMLNLQ